MESREHTPYNVCRFLERCITFQPGDTLCEDDFTFIGNMEWAIVSVEDEKDDDIRREELIFRPLDLNAFGGNWKIEGKLAFMEHDRSEKLFETSFCCDKRHPTHKFVSEAILEKNLDYYFHFTNLIGMGVTPRPNYFEASGMTDVCLIVGEGEDKVKLHLSKAVLAHFSEYFKAMFYGNFEERNKPEVELKDVCANDFIKLLDICFGAHLFQNEEEHQDEIHDLFMLADRFSMFAASARLQSSVLEHYEAEWNMTYLVWADKFQLNLLMSRVMEEFSPDDVQVLLNMKEIHELRAETVVTVLRIFAGGKK